MQRQIALSTLLQLLLLLPLLGLSFLLYLLWAKDYDAFSELLLNLADKNDWKAHFQQKILPPARFSLLRILSCLCWLGYLFVWLWSLRFVGLWTAALQQDIKYLFSKFYVAILQGKKNEQLLFCLLILLFIARSIYHIHYYELQYDEAWSYNHFSSKGMLVSALSPNNNHILYSLLSAGLDNLYIPTKWAVRLPALLPALATLLLFFAFIKHLFGFRVAFFSLLLLAFSGPLSFFSVLGRGYGLMLFFCIISLVSIYGMLKVDGNKKLTYQKLYIFAHILGIYSNIGFGYLWVGNIFVYLFLMGTNWTNFLSFIKINLLALLFSLVCYLPMILAGGAAVLGDAAVAGTMSEADGNFGLYLNRLADWLLWGKGWPLFWLAPCLAALLFWARFWVFTTNKNAQILIVISLIHWSLPFLFFIITKIEIPYRVWNYEWIYLALPFGILIAKMKYVWLSWPIVMLISGLNFYASETHYFMHWSADLDREAKKMAEKLLNLPIPPKECFSFSRYDKPLLEYYFLSRGLPFKCYMPFKESKNYRPFAEHSYEVLLLDTDDYKPTKEDWEIIARYEYSLIYKNQRVQLFLKNN